jgi:hypothetical protein
MNLFGFVYLGMAVVSTQGSARSGLGYRNLGRRSPVLAIGLMRGGKACAPHQRIARRPLRVQHAHRVDLTVFQFRWLPADPR